jgi:hypothetical protein
VAHSNHAVYLLFVEKPQHVVNHRAVAHLGVVWRRAMVSRIGHEHISVQLAQWSRTKQTAPVHFVAEQSVHYEHWFSALCRLRI